MTKDEALTMIIASIAMEELALSHIVNVEGEKLQYILGTLSRKHEICASTQEVLAVNKSVKELLDTVMQSQMLLKGKLEKALEASGRVSVPAPGPICPCKPVQPDKPPCGGVPCGRKSAIELVSRCKSLSWANGSFMSWKCQEQRGNGIRWNEKDPTLVHLDGERVYMLNYTVNVRDPYPGDGAGAVFVKLTPCDAFSSVLPLYFSLNCMECKPLTLHYSAVLFPQACSPSCADLSLLLRYRDRLLVEQASLSIAEI